MIDSKTKNKRTEYNNRPRYSTFTITTLKKVVKQVRAKNVLEVGILNGGSRQSWSDCFAPANVYGIDIMH
jgi:hypothetical protein